MSVPFKLRYQDLMRIAVAGPLVLGLTVVPALPQSVEANPSAPSAYGPPARQEITSDRPATPIAIPMALDRAASLAARTHPLVGAAEAEADALAAELRGAKRGKYASASVEALAATEGSSFADQDGLAINAVVEQPIWFGGRIDGAIDRARSTLGAGEGRVDLAQRQIVNRVIRAYYDYVVAAERLNVLQDSLKQHQDLLASIERRVQQEVSPMADLTLGRSRTAQVELDLTSALESRDIAKVQLFELTGVSDIVPVLPPPSVVDVLPPEETALAEAMGCDPNLAVLTNLVAASEAERDVAKAQLLPQLLLQLSQNEITGTRGALVLRMQLGNGAPEFAAIDSADARIKRALAEFGEAQRSQREQLRRQYVLVRASQSRIDVSIDAANAADQITASYRRQFIAGRRSWLDVMNAVREAANARRTESDARVMAAMGTAQILALTCRWQPDLPSDAAPDLSGTAQ